MSINNKVRKQRAGEQRLVSREAFAVSRSSLWTDLVWRLDTETDGQRNHIGWKFELPDGSCSTDAVHSQLLEGFREVLWGMLKNVGSYGRALSPGSAGPFGAGMRELFRWMILRGYRSFAELDADAHQTYLGDIPIILASPSKFYSARISPDDIDHELSAVGDDSDSDHEEIEQHDDVTEEKYTYGQVATRINTLYYVYSQSKPLKLRGIAAMPTKPFPGKSAGDVVSTVVKHTINRIPPLPDEIALPLLQEALLWTQHKAQDVLRLQEAYLVSREKASSLALPREKAKQSMNAAISGYEFACLPGDNRPWRHNIYGEPSHHPSHGKTFLVPTQVLRNLIMRARDACVIVLQYMAGLRIGEVCSIKGGWNYEENLPSCIIRRFSKSGTMELFFLKATLSKGEDQPIEEEWLLGCRPVGSTFFPSTVYAISVLEKLYRPWRELGKKDSLIISFCQRKSLPQKQSSVGRITTAALLRGAKHFVYSEVDLSGLPDRNERNEDLAMFRDTRGLCIRTYHGRKTFAAYILETRSSLLKAVSQHFKHLNVAITEKAYFPASHRIRAESESIIIAESISFFVGAIQGRRLEGRMADLVKDYFGAKEWQNIKDYAELEREVTGLVQTHDLRIFFSDHGKCLIKANPVQSRCQEAAGKASWYADTPNYAARSPNLCSGCGCFLVDASNLEFWKQRESALSKLVSEARANGVSREFRVHAARYEQARKVIKLIEGDTLAPR